MSRDRMNVGSEMYGHTSNNWSRWNSNRGFKEKLGSHARKKIK
jgi:hypothetical protein